MNCPMCKEPMNRAKMMGEKVDVCKPHGVWLDKKEASRVGKKQERQENALKQLTTILKKKGITIGRVPLEFVGGTLKLAGNTITNFSKILTK